MAKDYRTLLGGRAKACSSSTCAKWRYGFEVEGERSCSCRVCFGSLVDTWCILSTFHLYHSSRNRTYVHEKKNRRGGEQNNRLLVALAYPASLLLSENYASQLHRSDLSRRLKNVNVLMYWRPQLESESKSELTVRMHLPSDVPQPVIASADSLYYCIALSLEEAECVRRAIDIGLRSGWARIYDSYFCCVEAWISKNVYLRTLSGSWLGTGFCVTLGLFFLFF